MSTPGIGFPGEQPQSWLPEAYWQYVPTSGAAPIDIAPVIEQTYLLVAEPYDPYNYNLLYWTDDPTESPWAYLGSITPNIADPRGGTDAWQLEVDDDGDYVRQTFTPEYASWQLVGRYWLRAGGTGDSAQCRIGLYRSGNVVEPLSVRTVTGPIASVTNISNYLLIGSLLTTKWTEIEVVYAALESTAQHTLRFSSGPYSTTGATVRYFRPQLQLYRTPDADGYVSTETRKTEDLNGPDGAPGEIVKVYLSNNGYASHSTDTPAHRLFPAALLEPYQLRVAPFMGDDLAPRLTPNYGEITIANADGDYDYLLDYSWDNRTITLYYGLYEDAFADFNVYSIGTSRGVETTSNVLTLRYADKMAEIDKNLQSLEYKGLGMAVRCDTAAEYVGGGALGWFWTLEDDITLEAFIRSYANQNKKMALIDRSSSTGTGSQYNRNYSLRWDCTSNNRLEYCHQYSNAQDVIEHSGTDTVPSAYKTDGLWHHYAVTVERSTKTVRFFVDGEQVGTDQTYSIEATGGWLSGLRMGRDAKDTSIDFLGDCAEMRVWRTLRSDEDIKKYSDKGFTDTEAEGLVCLWRLNEGVGTTAGNERYSAVWHDASQHDGTDDGAAESSASTLAIATDWSIGVWFQQDGGVSDATHIFGQGNWGSVAIIRLRTTATDGYLQWHVKSNGGSNLYPGLGGLTNYKGRLFFAMLTYDYSEDLLTSYINYDEDQRTYAYDSGTDNWNLNQIAVGANSGQTNEFFGGQVYQGAIWSRCLTATEVKALNDDGEIDLSDAALECAYDFATWNDLTANGRDFTASGSVLLKSNGTLNPGGTPAHPTWVGSGEGGLDLLGKYVPTITGRVHHVEPVLLDPFNFVYQIAEGPLRDVTAVYEGGDEETFGFTTDDDIWGASFGGKSYVINLDTGLMKAASGPSYPVTVDVKGDDYGGEWRADAGFIVKRILIRRHGFTWPDDFDWASFDEIDQGSALGIYTGLDNLNTIEALNRVMGSIHGAAFFDRAARMKVVQVPPMDGTDSPTFEITSSDVLYDGIEVRPITPNWRETILYAPYWRPLSDQEVVGSASGSKADLAKEFRSLYEEDTFVRDNWLGSQDKETETLLYTDAAATREALARFNRFCVPRRAVEITLPMGAANLDVGAVGKLVYERFGIVPEGKNIFIVQLEEDLTSKQVRILAWC